MTKPLLLIGFCILIYCLSTAQEYTLSRENPETHQQIQDKKYVISMAQVSIIPQPLSMQLSQGYFELTSSIKIFAADSSVLQSVNFINDYLNEYYGFSLVTVSHPNEAHVLLINKNKKNEIPGAYLLTVNKEGITIKGDDAEGVFYGIQTLIQLLPVTASTSLSIPYIQVTDAPRFAYRGMMLDVCRHFFDVDYVKKYIDFLALHKINKFHWHLTEDQGWRIEIKKYPLLAKTGGCRNGTITGNYPGDGNDAKPDCGYYTQQQITDIVQYAADRYITVIPEIEMPGHASAAIAAYPLLSCFPDEPTKPADGVKFWAGPNTGKQVQQAWGVYEDVFCPTEYTFHFLEDVLDEVISLFPSGYIHIGGDECPKEAWKRSPYCQQLILEKGLKDEHGLQSYFISRIEKYLNSKGRNIIGWDEILEGGLAPKATVMSWRGEDGGIEAARQKHHVIMAPNSHVYFDHGPNSPEDSLVIGGYLPLEKVYSYNPMPDELTADEQQYVLGAQANLWTEYISSPAKVEYMLFPRLTALSEVLWSKPENKSWPIFQQKMESQYKRYDLWGVGYSKPKS